MKETNKLDFYNPMAYVTKRKQRVKQFGDMVYLSNNEEFEIELFNPLSTHVLAKIKLEGKYISGGGIVVRPGERVFLERYLDDNKKFVFKTYEVGQDAVAHGAILNNDALQIEFYDEETYYAAPNNQSTPWVFHNYLNGVNPSYTNDFFYSTSGGSTLNLDVSYKNPLNSTLTSTISVGNASTNVLGYNQNGYALGKARSKSSTEDGLMRQKTVETGTVEKGSISGQQFSQSSREFNLYARCVTTWKILPISQKKITADELNSVFCVECGAKKKKESHKFCPHCGNRY